MRGRFRGDPANDNAPRAAPKVRTPRTNPHARYAVADGVILPLRFAQRMAGWTMAGDSRMTRRVYPRGE